MSQVRSLGIVISTGHRNWAIGELAKGVRSFFPHSSIIEIPQSRRELRSLRGFLYWPKYSRYLFMHHSLAIKAWEKGWIQELTEYGIRYTHESVAIEDSIEVFLRTKFITVENLKSKSHLTQKGLDANTIHFLPHPIDYESFQNLAVNKSRDVIFVSNFYERKNPELILQVIRNCPDLQFSILGKGWETWSKFSELCALNNFQYKTFSYKEYPWILSSHRVFCSLSNLEGGPVPLIESLAAGLKVVATDTGHIRDVLSYREPYNIVPIDAKLDVVCSSLRQALAHTSPRHLSLSRFDTENYMRKLKSLLEL